MSTSGKSVCILDYGSGNVRSVYNMFRSLIDCVEVSNDPSNIRNASHLVLPGVGSFGAAMKKVQDVLDLSVLEKAVLGRRVPFLGICVGMQILANKGYENGAHKGLGWIGGAVRRLETDALSLPHVGWNDFTYVRDGNPLMEGILPQMDFYYVHSYHFQPDDRENITASCAYGMEFASIVNRDNIYGVQFHPEKSQRAGRKILNNFLKLS